MDNTTIREFLQEKGKIPTGPGCYNNSMEIANSIAVRASTGDGDIDTLVDRSITDIKSSVIIIGNYAFAYCNQLLTAEFSNVTVVGMGAFAYCTKLSTVIIRGSQIPTIATGAGSPFFASPIALGTGYIYVPDELVDNYKATEGWSTYADQIKGISELPTE